MKKVLYPVFFAVLSLIVILGAYRILSWKDTMGESWSSIRQLDQLPSDTVDMVFVGSSHVASGVMPAVLWKNYGVSAFNLSISGMDKDSSYYHLKYLLETQSPKLVCVDLFALTYDSHAILGNEYRNMLSLPISKDQYDMIYDYLGEENNDYLLKWPIIHSRYSELKKEDFYDDVFSQNGKGELVSFHKTGYTVDTSTAIACNESVELSEKNKLWIDRLYALSKEYDFELVLFVLPFAGSDKEQSIINGSEQYIKSLGLPFYDFTKNADILNIDYDNDFIDSTHLNAYGGGKTANWFGEAYSSQLVDHRGDSLYDSWNYDLLKYEHDASISVYKTLSDFNTKLEMFPILQNITFIVSLDGKWKSSTLPLTEYLETFGICETEISNGGAWIGKPGNMIKLVDNDNENAVYYKLNRYDEVKIQKGNEAALENIKINSNSFQQAHNGLTIIVWDDINKRVIDKMGLY